MEIFSQDSLELPKTRLLFCIKDGGKVVDNKKDVHPL